MADAQPFTLQGTLVIAPDEGQAQVPLPFSLSNQYQSIAEARLVMSGTGDQEVPFGSVGSPGAKAVVIEYEDDPDADPIQLTFNGGDEEIELSPGGFFVYASPNPATGITAISIARTSDAVVRVRVLG
jgi:hypothetical protein